MKALARVSSFLAFALLPLIFDMGCADTLTEPKLACWLVAAGAASLTPLRPWSLQEKFLAAWFGWSCLSSFWNGPSAGWIDLLTVAAGLLWVRAEMPDRWRFIGIGFGLTVTYSWVQRLGLDPFSWSNPNLSQVRTIAGLGNPNYLSMYLACLLPWIWSVVYPRGPIGWLVGLISMLTLLLTATRGSILCLLVALGLCTAWGLVFQRRGHRFWLVSWLLVLAAWSISWAMTSRQSQAFAQQMTSLRNPGQAASVTFRKYLYGTALKVAIHSPWLGVGPGHFGNGYLLYRPLEPYIFRPLQRRPENPHTEPLKVLSETGVVGLFFWCGWVGLGLLDQFRKPGPQTACLMVLLANCLSNCIPVAIWPILLMLTTPERTDREGKFRWQGVPALLLAFVLALPGWYVQHLFWWDEEYRVLAEKFPEHSLECAEARLRVLQKAELFCPPWEQTTLLVLAGNAWQNLAGLTGSPVAWEQSESMARRRLQLEPDNPYAWISLGGLLDRQAKYPEALAAWQEARRRDNLNPVILYLLARTQYASGQADAALKSLDESLEIFSDSSQVYGFRAQIMIDQGKVWEGYWDWVRSQQVLESYRHAVDVANF
ncbi:O-antigen ligase family protein [bacterium]|nr:O-antigen ligase family protein [bacterium]